MMPIARVLVTTTLLCLLPLQGAVAAAYKWVDDKGETHYSQTPPSATQVEVIKTPSSSGSAPAAAAPQTGTSAPSEPTAGAAGTPEAAKAEDASIREKNCASARRNLELLLKNTGEVTVKDENGLLHALTPDERKTRSEEAEKNIKEYCKD